MIVLSEAEDITDMKGSTLLSNCLLRSRKHTPPYTSTDDKNI